MRIVITGGGSGGHIIPLLAVAHELKLRDPTVRIIYIGQTGDALSDVPANDPNVDEVFTVSAGKLRRYSGEGLAQLFDIQTQFLNIRDVFRVVRGSWQSFWLLRKLRPDVIFTRGGFVSVPVALGGKLNHVPYITHDSDSVPSLANRIIARGATLHAVALPAELYPYPQDKTFMVGIPVSANYVPVDTEKRQQYRKQLGLEQYEYVLLVTGGGNGARLLNQTLVANTRYLLGAVPKLAIVHLTGRALEAETNAAYDALELGSVRSNVHVYGFVQNLQCFSGASDVVIARGGATNLAEFAIQGLACLIVPSKQLSWNVKNAAALYDRDAIVQLTEDQAEQPERLGRAVEALLTDGALRKKLAARLSGYAHPHAASELADILVSIGNGQADVRSEQ